MRCLNSCWMKTATQLLNVSNLKIYKRKKAMHCKEISFNLMHALQNYYIQVSHFMINWTPLLLSA